MCSAFFDTKSPNSRVLAIVLILGIFLIFENSALKVMKVSANVASGFHDDSVTNSEITFDIANGFSAITRRNLKVEGRITERFLAPLNGSNEYNFRKDDGNKKKTGDKKAKGTALLVLVERGSKPSIKYDLYYWFSVIHLEGRAPPTGVALVIPNPTELASQGIYRKTTLIPLKFPGKWIQKGKISQASFTLRKAD